MEELIQSLKELIVYTGQLAVSHKAKGLTVENKEDDSPVTNADKEISKIIIEKLKVLTPDIEIISEEEPPINLKADTFWLVDPIDGTRSYVRGEETYTVNIGLIKNNIPTLGLIYIPEMQKLYYVDANGNLKIEHAGIAQTIPEILKNNNYKAVVSSHYSNRLTRRFLKDYSINEVMNIPSSIKLCLVAEGSADIYPKFGQTMEWDIAAGHALIRATGGDVVDLSGHTLTYGKPHFENPHFLACSSNWLARN